MILSPKFFSLKNWLLYSDKPDERGCCIIGLKNNAPENIKNLYNEYMELISNRE